MKQMIAQAEPVHEHTGLTLTEFRRAEARAQARRARWRKGQQELEQQTRYDEQVIATNAAIAAAPERIALDEFLTAHPHPASHKPRLVADGQFVLVRPGTKSWGLHAGNGLRVVGGTEFSADAFAGSPKAPGIRALTDLAEHLAAIHDADDRPAPWTSLEPKWHEGWRGPDGLTIMGAVISRITDWAAARDLRYVRAWAAGRLRPRPIVGGAPDQDGFYRRDAEEAAPGDQVRCPDGAVRTVASNDVVSYYRSGSREYKLVLKFVDGERLDGARHVDIAFTGDPDAPEARHNPGMGGLIGEPPGIPAGEQSGPYIRLRLEDLVPPGTRIVIHRSEADAGWYDVRSVVGTATDRVLTYQGEHFQVFRYDDGTHDGAKPSAFRREQTGKVRYLVDPSPEQIAEVRAAWNMPG